MAKNKKSAAWGIPNHFSCVLSGAWYTLATLLSGGLGQRTWWESHIPTLFCDATKSEGKLLPQQLCVTTRVKSVRALSEGVTDLNTLIPKVKAIKDLKPDMVLFMALLTRLLTWALMSPTVQLGLPRSSARVFCSVYGGHVSQPQLTLSGMLSLSMTCYADMPAQQVRSRCLLITGTTICKGGGHRSSQVLTLNPSCWRTGSTLRPSPRNTPELSTRLFRLQRTHLHASCNGHHPQHTRWDRGMHTDIQFIIFL